MMLLPLGRIGPIGGLDWAGDKSVPLFFAHFLTAVAKWRWKRRKNVLK